MEPRFTPRNLIQGVMVFCLSLFQRMKILHQLYALQISSSRLQLTFSIHSLLFRSTDTCIHMYKHVCMCVCAHIISMLYMCQIVLFVSTLRDTSKPQGHKNIFKYFLLKVLRNFHFFCVQNKRFNFTFYNMGNHLP